MNKDPLKKSTSKIGAFLKKPKNIILIPFLIGIPILCLLNFVCYQKNERHLKLPTNLVLVGTMFLISNKLKKD